MARPAAWRVKHAKFSVRWLFETSAQIGRVIVGIVEGINESWYLARPAFAVFSDIRGVIKVVGSRT
jgi:hypothetical protein